MQVTFAGVWFQGLVQVHEHSVSLSFLVKLCEDCRRTAVVIMHALVMVLSNTTQLVYNKKCQLSYILEIYMSRKSINYKIFIRSEPIKGQSLFNLLQFSTLKPIETSPNLKSQLPHLFLTNLIQAWLIFSRGKLFFLA